MIDLNELEKILPQNLEAEMCLLGSLLLDKEAIYHIIDFIDQDDFYSIKHNGIFSGYLELFNAGTKIDIVTMSEKLKSKKQLEAIGGVGYLTRLINSVVTVGHIKDYAKIVKDKSLRRQILSAQETNTQEVYDDEKEINQLLAEVQNRLYEVNPLKTKNDSVQSILKDLNTLQEEYSKKYEEGKNIIGFSSGNGKIDNLIDGLRPGHLWVIGAWHGTGKTSYALNIVHSLLEQEIPVSIVSTEMSQTDLTAKLIGIRHRLSSMKVIKGILDKETKNNIDEGKLFLNHSNLDIHTDFDFEKIKMIIRKDVYTKGVKVVMIDYIQKITHGKIYEETPLMSRIAHDLSNLAQELKITILLLSQISNAAQKGGGAGAGYKGSGAIEASADFALVLKRDKTREEPDAEWVEMKIQVSKNKFGLDGTIDMWFHLKSGQVSLTPYDL